MITPPPSPIKPGDALPSAAWFNRYLRMGKSVRSTWTGPQLGGGAVPTRGQRVRVESTDPFWGKLTGSTSPYSFSECFPNGSVLTGGRTGNVIEVNGVAGLNNKVVRIWPEGGEYLTYWSRLGSPCAGTLCVKFTVCNYPQVGATIVITPPTGPVINGTTDANGTFCAPITQTGSYHVTASNGREHVAQDRDITATCTANFLTINTNDPADGFHCTCQCGPLKDTLTLSFAGKSLTLTYGAGGGDPLLAGLGDWGGCVTFDGLPGVHPAPSGPDCEGIYWSYFNISCGVTGNLPVWFQSNGCTLTWFYPIVSVTSGAGRTESEYRIALGCPPAGSGPSYWSTITGCSYVKVVMGGDFKGPFTKQCSPYMFTHWPGFNGKMGCEDPFGGWLCYASGIPYFGSLLTTCDPYIITESA